MKETGTNINFNLSDNGDVRVVAPYQMDSVQHPVTTVQFLLHFFIVAHEFHKFLQLYNLQLRIVRSESNKNANYNGCSTLSLCIAPDMPNSLCSVCTDAFPEPANHKLA